MNAVLKNKTTKMGRPSLFEMINKVQMQKLYRAGFTDKQVADFFGVNEDTIHEWKKVHPDFSESVKDWKAEADIEVEKSLYKNATGYVTKNQKAVVVSDGKDAGSHVEMVEETIEHPPNPTSGIFWLSNRKPRDWKRSQAVVDPEGGEEGQAPKKIVVQIINVNCQTANKTLTIEKGRAKLDVEKPRNGNGSHKCLSAK